MKSEADLKLRARLLPELNDTRSNYGLDLLALSAIFP